MSLLPAALLAVSALSPAGGQVPPRIVAQANAGLVAFKVVESCPAACYREGMLQWRDASGKVLLAISVPELPNTAQVESVVAEWGAGTPARFSVRLAKKGGTVTIEIMGQGQYRATGP